MDDCLNLLDSQNPVLSVGTPLPWFYAGPQSLLWYTLIQGILTVLAIKEVWSIASVVTKGRSADLHLDRVVRWNLVENWEDLRKTFQRIIVPCVKDLYRRLPFVEGEGRIKKHGWKLVFSSFIVAFGLFAFDVALIYFSAPSLSLIAAKDIESITWSNTGQIPKLKYETDVLQGSFSRTIVKESRYNDIEMIRQSSVSLERTDILDFKNFVGILPSFDSANRTFFECDGAEEWRIVCRVYTKNRLYQYKLRLDVTTDDGDSYFVPVTNFSSLPNATNPLERYVQEIQSQLKIYPTIGFRNATTFRLRSEVQPAEWTKLRRTSATVLTHDAIVTLFLRSIEICSGPKNAMLQLRKKGKRRTMLNLIGGNEAKSQRPRVTLIATALMYAVTAIISMILQGNMRVNEVAKDLDVIFELMGKPKDTVTGVLNITAAPLKVIESNAVVYYGEEKENDLLKNCDTEILDANRVIVRHEGFLHASFLLPLARFHRHRTIENNSLG